MTLKCTFASNCNLEAIWYKTESHNLTSDDDIVNIGNYTRVVIYKREYALETYAKFIYKCKIEDTPVVKVQLIVKGKFASKKRVRLLQPVFLTLLLC